VEELPVDLIHWLVAVAPVVVLLILLAGRGWTAQRAGPVAMVLAAVSAMVVFQTPFATLLTSIGAGLWDAVFVLLVVWSALLLYRVTAAAGAFDALRSGIERFSQNRLFLVMAFGWVFASFLQGVAGFGVPVAVVAPLLVALGVKPVAAVVIPLIGHAWANTFGTLGVAWLAMEQVIDVKDPTTTVLQAAVLLWIPNLLAGFTVAWLFGRGPAVRHAWPMVLVISLVHGGGQLAVVAFNPVLSAFLASAAALLALYPLSRWSRYDEPVGADLEDLPAIEDDAKELGHQGRPNMSFAWSLVPYAVLTISAVVALAIPPVQEALETFELGPAISRTTTGYDVERPAADPYSPITPLTHPAAFLLLATAAAAVAYRAKGYFAMEPGRSDPAAIARSTASDAVPASIAIVTFLVLAQVLDYSGQTEVLARGIANAIPPTLFAALASAIGVLGAFMTSSNTSANLLFADLQQSVAESGGLPEPPILAAQTAGAAVGNAIGPASIVLGTSTAGIQGEEGAVLRRTLPWTAATTVAVGAATVLLL
jgi:lactate permease